MNTKPLIYVLIMIFMTNFIRIVPFTLIRDKIKNKFICSFLYYVPYVTLAVMTFPAIMEATKTPIAGIAALVLGIIAAYLELGLFPVAIVCCLCVFGVEWFMI